MEFKNDMIKELFEQAFEAEIHGEAYAFTALLHVIAKGNYLDAYIKWSFDKL